MTDQECRQRAFECARLSQSSPDPRVRDKFAALAKTWITLAADIERSAAAQRADRSRGGSLKRDLDESADRSQCLNPRCESSSRPLTREQAPTSRCPDRRPDQSRSVLTIYHAQDYRRAKAFRQHAGKASL